MKKEYCYGCGSELKITKYIGGYKIDTGKPVYYRKSKCPNWRFWNFLNHTNFDSGKSGGAGTYI